MNRLNRKVEYALMALKHMAKKRSGELSSAKEIALALKLPFDATARCLQLLAQQGVLKVVQGASGGYAITKDLGSVSFYELVAAIEGPLEIARCIGDHEGCELLSTCNIQSPVSILNSKMAQFYRELMLSEILSVSAPMMGRIS